jgi:hypothetical protein
MERACAPAAQEDAFDRAVHALRACVDELEHLWGQEFSADDRDRFRELLRTEVAKLLRSDEPVCA